MNANPTTPPDQEKPGATAKKPWFCYGVPTAIFLIGLASIVLLLGVNRINADARRDDLIAAALMDVKINATTGHLWLEEAVSGDETADEVLANMDEAIKLSDIVLHGGESEDGLIVEALRDRGLRGQIEALRSLLVNFKKLAEERLRNAAKSGIASDLDQQFDAAFKELLNKAGGLEEIIKKNDAEEQVKAGRLFLGILAAWIFIVIATTARLWSDEARRKNAEAALAIAPAVESAPGQGTTFTDTAGAECEPCQKRGAMNVGLIAPPDKEKQVSATKKPWLCYWVPTAVFLIGLASIVLLLWVNRINAHARRDALLTSAFMDVQIKAATGHLWLEEAVSGDDTADEALVELDQAIKLIEVVLNGGETEHGLIPEPLLVPEWRGQTEALRSLLVNFKELAEERLQNVEKAGIASNLDQQFDAAFKDLLNKARGLEEIITKKGAEEQVKAGRLFLGILSAWVFIVIATTAGLWSREVRRKSAEEALLQAHAQLLAQTTELTEHRAHLTELVELRTGELTQANELLRGEIDERKRMEGEVLKLNEELELKVEERTRQLFEIQEDLVRGEKLAILGQLSGSVGHELRNPLGVMSNAIYFLQLLHADADATTREYLEIIKQEIDTALRIITDLLDFTRTKVPERVVVSAAEVVRHSLERCTIPENVAVTVDLPDGLPRLNVDPLQLGQVLTNIITNGVQAMPAGGALRVAARLVGAPPCGCPEAGGHGGPPLQDFIEISVTDSGEGIAPENMAKLFQPLFTTKARGIGLGLVVCKNLVEANGGKIEVASEPGKGACFTVKLPGAEGEG